MRSPGEQQPEGGADGASRILAGRYRVTGRLGRGGMGVVWRAVDEVLGREVAVKELRTYNDAGSGELEELRTRMQREARAAARVRHSGVIAVHDVAQHEGRPVIVMELVEGPSLDDVLRERGSIEPREAAAVGAEVMDALAAAHAVGVMHRDVKPGNVLLEKRGQERVVLTDFGIAAMEDPDDGASTNLTVSGELVGSLDYLAPERARGEPPCPASDVWALGATLYAAVEGAAPFRRTSTWSTLNAIVVDPLPEPSRAGPLAPVLAELMEKDPGRRAHAERAAALLRAVAAGTELPPVSGTLRLGQAEGPHSAAASPDPPGPAAPPRQGPQAPHEPTARGDAHPAAGAAAARGASGPETPAGRGAGPGHQHPGAQGPLSGQSAGAGSYGQGHGQDESPDTDRDTDRDTLRRGSPSRGRRGALVAAAAVAVLLTGAGATYTVMAQDGDEGTRAAESSGKSGSSDAEGADARKDAGRKSGDSDPSPSGPGSDGPKAGAAAGGPAGGQDDGRQSGDGDEDDKGSGGGSDSGGTGSDAGDGGGSAGGGAASGGGPAPAPACHPSGGGKYDCSTWKTATSYDGGHQPVGQLNAGNNYFFCQSKLSHRETSGRWTNVWWAKTDDDSGNSAVYVSVVYIRGGGNDEPLPGLPTC